MTPTNESGLQALDDSIVSEIVSLGDLLELNIESVPCLWEPYFRDQGVHALVGEPDSGKSLFALQFAMSIATRQTTFLGHPLHPRHYRALYVETEDDKSEMARRTKRMIASFQDRHPEFADGLQFIIADIDGGDSKERYRSLIDSYLSENPVDLVIVSSFGDVFMGTDSNSNNQMRETVNMFNSLGIRRKTLFLLIHHVNKAAYGNLATQAHVQGGSGFAQKVRCVVQIRAREDGQRTFHVLKGNHIPSANKREVLILEFEDKTLTCAFTGRKENKSEASARNEIDWVTIFGSDSELEREELMSRILTRHQYSTRFIDQRLRQDLNRVRKGVYTLKNLALAHV